MNTPLKNGVVLFLEEYRCYLRADVYELPGYGWLFRANNNREYLPDDDEDFKILFVHSWFDEHQTHGTILVPHKHVLVFNRFYQKLEPEDRVRLHDVLDR